MALIGRKKQQPEGQEEYPKPPINDEWGILVVLGSDTRGKPFSCLNCHMLWKRQKRCAIIGPDIIIAPIDAGGFHYTPVCGQQDSGKPMDVPDNKVIYPASIQGIEKADAIGLEWAKGNGTNCGGVEDGAKCQYFLDGHFCTPLQSDRRPDDCCAQHKGPSMTWREAQKYLK